MPLRARVLTPERALFEGGCEGAVIPAWDGLRGVRPGHAHQIGRLGTGTLELQGAEGKTLRFFLSGGFYEARPDALLLLTAEAREAGAIAPADADAALAAARALPAKTDAERDRKDRATLRARALSRAASKRG